MTLIVLLAAVVAVAAAVRGTWSPCGLSMLSTVTPLAERSRGHRYGVTASWFVLGGVLGGATLGAAAALLAWGVAATGLSAAAALGVAAVAAVVAAGSDARLVGVQLPGHIRQVNENWLNQFRAWVYGVGFGWQIGVGLATYIMTAAVYLTIVLAALAASPAAALGIGALFGLVRGAAIFLSAGCTTPERLMAFHRRFEAWREPVRYVVIALQAGVAGVAAFAAWGVAAPSLLITAVAVASVGILTVRRWDTTPTSLPPAVPADLQPSAR